MADRSPSCPLRWRLHFSSRYSRPPRPVTCPCMWSKELVDSHALALLENGDDLELALRLSALIALMWDSSESP